MEKPQMPGRKQLNFGAFRKGMVFFVAVVLVVVFSIRLSIAVVDAGFAGIIYNANGGIEKQVLNQGWHLVAPWKKVIQYPVSTETMFLSAKGDEGASADTSINVGTNEGKMVNIDVAVTYHYDANALPTVFTKFRGQDYRLIEANFLKQNVKNSINTATSAYSTFDVYSAKRSEASQKAFVIARDTLEKSGIVVETLVITDVNPDEQTKAAIQANVTATQELRTAELRKKKAEITAQTAVVEAQGIANALLVQRQAEAKGNAIVSASLTPQLIEYKKWGEKWDGKLPATMTGSGSTLLIDPSKK